MAIFWKLQSFQSTVHAFLLIRLFCIFIIFIVSPDLIALHLPAAVATVYTLFL